MEIVPNLHFSGDCEDAIKLYERALGAECTVLLRYKEANPTDWQASHDQEGELVYHAEIMLGDRQTAEECSP
jgi:PhnB protein